MGGYGAADLTRDRRRNLVADALERDHLGSWYGRRRRAAVLGPDETVLLTVDVPDDAESEVLEAGAQVVIPPAICWPGPAIRSIGGASGSTSPRTRC